MAKAFLHKDAWHHACLIIHDAERTNNNINNVSGSKEKRKLSECIHTIYIIKTI